MLSSGTNVGELSLIKTQLTALEKRKLSGDVIGSQWMQLSLFVCQIVANLVQAGRIGHTPLTLMLLEFKDSPPKDWRYFPTREDVSLIHNAIDTSISALELAITNQ